MTSAIVEAIDVYASGSGYLTTVSGGQDLQEIAIESPYT